MERCCRTNYDIEELGLTAAAAAKLYTGELDPHIVSRLLENPCFPQLVEQLRAFVDGTESVALGTYRQTLSITARLLQKQGKTNPRDKAAAKLAMKDLRSHMIPPILPDILVDFVICIMCMYLESLQNGIVFENFFSQQPGRRIQKVCQTVFTGGIKDEGWFLSGV